MRVRSLTRLTPFGTWVGPTGRVLTAPQALTVCQPSSCSIHDQSPLWTETANRTISPTYPASLRSNSSAALLNSPAFSHHQQRGMALQATMPPSAEPDFHRTSSGADLAFHRVLGSGNKTTGVIFCPGLNSSMDGVKAVTLEKQARQQGHPFVRYDYQGHGQSSGTFIDKTLGEWYQDTLDIIDHVAEPGGHILVGSSIGAWIALKAAAARRERVAGLVLLAPAVDITESWWDAMDEDTRRLGYRTGFVHVFSEYNPDGLALRTAFFDEAQDHFLLDRHAKDLQVRCPVRILHGSKDSLVPPKVSEELMQWLETPDVHLTMIKDGDHRLSRPQDLRTLLLMVEGMVESIRVEQASSK